MKSNSSRMERWYLKIMQMKEINSRYIQIEDFVSKVTLFEKLMISLFIQFMKQPIPI